MTQLSNNLIYNYIFPYIQYDSNVVLVNKKNYKLYLIYIKKKCSLIIYNFIIKNTINIDYLLKNIRYINYSHSKIIRYYLKYYPNNYLTKLIILYPKKLNRPELSIVKNNYTFRDLYNIQKKCTVNEIRCVGW